MNNDLDAYLRDKLYVNLEEMVNNISFEHVVVDLFVSDRCNLRCRHCYFSILSKKEESLSYEEWIATIDLFYKLGVRHFHLSGKESSLCEDTTKILRYIRQRYPDSYTGIVTNGTGTIEYYQTLLNNIVDYVEFSVDGLEDIHNYMRRKDVYQIVYSNVKNLLEYSHKLNLTTCVNQWNVNQYLQLIEIYYELGIRRFFVTPVINVGNGEQLTEFSLTSSELVDFIDTMFDFITNKQNEHKGIVVKLCLTEETTRQLWKDSSKIREHVKNFVEKGSDLIFRLNGNILQLAYSIVGIEYFNNLSITNDGYVLPCSDDVSRIDYVESSLFNVKKITPDEVVNLRKNNIYQQLTIYTK